MICLIALMQMNSPFESISANSLLQEGKHQNTYDSTEFRFTLF